MLAAWLFGDSFKTVYYFLTANNSIAFKVPSFLLCSFAFYC